MRVAALDLGSNTTLLLIAEVEDGQVKRVLADETTITRLGQGVHAARRFHPEALERMRECLQRYEQIIARHKCEKVVAVATSAARDVSNGHELVAMAAACKIPVHIIAGAKEAELTFRGALSDRSHSEGVAVIDVGGGSTEIISLVAEKIVGQSVDVGSVRLSEMYIHRHPIPEEEVRRAGDYARQEFAKRKFSSAGIKEVVAVAGTPTTLAALDQRQEFTETLVNGYKMPLRRIEEWTDRLAKLSVSEREKLPGMQPKRADVIVAGSLILSEAVKALHADRITVSTRGVRYGVALACTDF